MLRRNLLIGSLVAGAFMLPSLAQAGAVTGACVGCHTMHASQNGAAIGTGNAQLLLGSGCVACHTGSSNGAATGKGGSFNAPQISDNVNVLSGGYIIAGVGMPAANAHSVVDGGFLAAETNMAIGTIPGTGGSRTGLVTDAAGFNCSDCHNGTGGHHGSSTDYRLLAGVTGQAGQTDYGVQPVGTANGNGDRSATAYNATTMNAFCASCHGGFHGAAQMSGTAFIRHPTDVSVVSGAGPSIQTITQTTDIDQTPVGRSNAGAADHVMCLSCHVPHGSARADLLSFSYDTSNNTAGPGGASIGCETCHSYGSGM